MAKDGSHPFEVQVDWEQLSRLVSDPSGALRAAYHWNDPGAPFDTLRLFDVLHGSFAALRFVAEPLYPAFQLDAQAIGPAASRVMVKQSGLRTTLLAGIIPKTFVDFGLGFDLWPLFRRGRSEPRDRPVVRAAFGGLDEAMASDDSFEAVIELEVDGGGALGMLLAPGKADGAARTSVRRRATSRAR